MKTLVQWIAGLLATSLVAGAALTGVVTAQDSGEVEKVVEAKPASAETNSAETGVPDEAQESVEDAVEESGSDAAANRRKSLIHDAVAALDETRAALKALENGDSEAALESLAVATGKLDLVVARNPSLALAPIDVRLVTHDLYATVEDIERARDRAAKQLKNGRLQDARALIEGLRSDIVVEVYNLPLATYPAAIKAISPLIDADEIDEAKVALQRALNTVVVTQHVHPLPVIRADHMLTRAEELATTADRTEEQSDELTRLLDGARTQLEIAQVLGYGQESDFEEFYEQLDEIAEKTDGGKSGEGFFAKIRSVLRSFGDDSSDGSGS